MDERREFCPVNVIPGNTKQDASNTGGSVLFCIRVTGEVLLEDDRFFLETAYGSRVLLTGGFENVLTNLVGIMVSVSGHPCLPDMAGIKLSLYVKDVRRL